MAHKDSTYFWILKPDLNTNQKTKRKREEGERERRWRWKCGGGADSQKHWIYLLQMWSSGGLHYFSSLPQYSPLFSLLLCLMWFLFLSFSLSLSASFYCLLTFLFFSLIIYNTRTFCFSLFPILHENISFLCFLEVWQKINFLMAGGRFKGRNP